MSDPVNRPAHYMRGTIQPIDFISDQRLNFNRGQIIKYTVRAGHKDPSKEVEDLMKARFYLEREIERAKIEIGLRELVQNTPEAEALPSPPRHWLAESEGV